MELEEELPLTPSKEKIVQAIKALGNNKTTGPDGVPAELIKYGGEALVDIYCRLIQQI